MSIKIYPESISITYGKSWLSIDKTGIMGWNNRKDKNWFILRKDLGWKK